MQRYKKIIHISVVLTENYKLYKKIFGQIRKFAMFDCLLQHKKKLTPLSSENSSREGDAEPFQRCLKETTFLNFCYNLGLRISVGFARQNQEFTPQERHLYRANKEFSTQSTGISNRFWLEKHHFRLVFRLFRRTFSNFQSQLYPQTEHFQGSK